MYSCENFATVKARYEQNFLQTPLKSLSLSPAHLHSSHIIKKSFIYLLGSVYWFLFFVKVVQLCSSLCNPMNWGLPGSSVHGILQAILLEWVSVPSPGDLPNPEIKPWSPTLKADSLLSELPEIVTTSSLFCIDFKFPFQLFLLLLQIFHVIQMKLLYIFAYCLPKCLFLI